MTSGTALITLKANPLEPSAVQQAKEFKNICNQAVVYSFEISFLIIAEKKCCPRQVLLQTENLWLYEHIY